MQIRCSRRSYTARSRRLYLWIQTLLGGSQELWVKVGLIMLGASRWASGVVDGKDSAPAFKYAFIAKLLVTDSGLEDYLSNSFASISQSKHLCPTYIWSWFSVPAFSRREVYVYSLLGGRNPTACSTFGAPNTSGTISSFIYILQTWLFPRFP